MDISPANYNKRVESQIKQFADVSDMHANLSDINAFWKRQYHAPRFRETTQARNHVDFYVKQFASSASDEQFCRIASLGSGDGKLEIQIALSLLNEGFVDLEFHLFEISPAQVKRAQQNILACKLEKQIHVILTDLNSWSTDVEYSGIMAHHSLHHVLALEHLFDQVYTALSKRGRFVTFDIIGRNGHLRWPEVYNYVNAFWHFLPAEKRHHLILKGFNQSDFKDHDCSTSGFEGIRSQDILKELISRFYFNVFFAWGGVTDIFTGRAYGHNFDPQSIEDRRFIGLVDEINEALIESQLIKPTNLCASLSKATLSIGQYYRDRTPSKMLRTT